MSVTTFHRLDGRAIKGRLAEKGHHESFVQGTMTDDGRMVLMFASQNMVRKSARRIAYEKYTRLVSCTLEVTPTGDDYWWEAKSQLTFKG